MTRAELLDTVLAMREVEIRRGAAPGVILVSPPVMAELRAALDPTPWQVPGQLTLYGMRVLVTRHLPEGIGFVLMNEGEAGPSGGEDFPYSAPEPVRAKSFDEWLQKTAELLEECQRRGR